MGSAERGGDCSRVCRLRQYSHDELPPLVKAPGRVAAAVPALVFLDGRFERPALSAFLSLPGGLCGRDQLVNRVLSRRQVKVDLEKAALDLVLANLRHGVAHGRRAGRQGLHRSWCLSGGRRKVDLFGLPDTVTIIITRCAAEPRRLRRLEMKRTESSEKDEAKSDEEDRQRDCVPQASKELADDHLTQVKRNPAAWKESTAFGKL